jgi:uncharacterized integral membrane protein
MRIKTMFIILITAALTVTLMQNTDRVNFDVLFWDFKASKLWVMVPVSIFAFILGILVGRPTKVKHIAGESQNDTLSQGDKNYIS